MTKATNAKPLPATVYEKFRDALELESPRAAYWLYSMQFGLMPQFGIDEPAALELACKIVLQDPQHAQERTAV